MAIDATAVPADSDTSTSSPPAYLDLEPEKKVSAGRSRLRKWRPFLLGTAGVVTVLVIWQLLTLTGWINPLFFPGPIPTFEALVNLFVTGTIWPDLAVSGVEYAIGLVLALVIGAVLGVLIGWYKRFGEFMRPLVIAVNAMPDLALIPVLILIFGIGLAPKIIIVLLACTIPVVINTAAGVENVDAQMMRLARSYGATDRQMIRTVVAPSVVPFFMAGARLIVGRALIAVVVAEIFASQAGVGHLLINASYSFNMPVMFAVLILLTFLGILLTQGFVLIERAVLRWKD